MRLDKSALGIVQKYHPNVTKVVDGKSPLTITVTPQDCKRSVSKAPEACALARACQRDYDGAIVSLSVAYMVKGNKAFRYRVPESISREIISFDRNHDFKPGTYSLKAPKGAEKLGYRPVKRAPDLRENHNAGNKPVRRNHITAGIRSL